MDHISGGDGNRPGNGALGDGGNDLGGCAARYSCGDPIGKNNRVICGGWVEVVTRDGYGCTYRCASGRKTCDGGRYGGPATCQEKKEERKETETDDRLEATGHGLLLLLPLMYSRYQIVSSIMQINKEALRKDQGKKEGEVTGA